MASSTTTSGPRSGCLVEVVRARDAEIRVARLDERLRDGEDRSTTCSTCSSPASPTMIENDPGFFLLLYELFSAGRRNLDIQREVGQLFERTCSHVAEVLGAKQREGVLKLRFDAEADRLLPVRARRWLRPAGLSDPERDNCAALRGRRRLGALPAGLRVAPDRAGL